MNGLKADNKGITMVEVLVCVVIISVVSVIVIKSFTVSAGLNLKAHNNQQATAVAQAVTEQFKSSNFEQLKLEFAVPASTEKWPDISILPIADRDNYPKECFTWYRYEKSGIKAEDGTEFDVSVELDPTKYSSVKDAFGMGPTAESAYSNSKGIGKIEGVDSLKSPVIASEVNRYDKAIAETFMNKMSQIEIDALPGSSHSEKIDTINTSSDLKKEITINIEPKSNQLEVSCFVRYTFSTFEEQYNVYSAVFQREYVDVDGKTKWISGNNVYLMIMPFTQGNDTVLVNNVGYQTSDLDKYLNVYVIRGTNSEYTNTDWAKMYNLAEVRLQKCTKSGGVVSVSESSVFMRLSPSQPAPEHGKKEQYSMKVVSNMQGIQGNTVLASETDTLKDAPVYLEENQQLRVMEMRVEVYSAGAFLLSDAEREKKKIVDIVTTKAVH